MTKYILILTAFVSSVSFADATANVANAANTSTAATTATTAATTGSGLTNAAGSSKSGSALAVVSEGITAGVGIWMGTQCYSSPQTHAMECFMAAMCAVQLLQSMASQKSADGVNAAYSPDGTSYNAVSGDPGGGGSGTPSSDSGTSGTGSTAANMASTTGGFAADLAKIQGTLAKAGVAIDSSGATPTVTLPNGTTVPLNSSADALKASGFDAANVDQTLADEKKLEASLLAKAGANQLAFQSAGGKSVSYGANPNAGSGNLDSYLKSLNANRKPGSLGKANVAGLSRKLGDENIGVKGDNIFDMVNRRYRAQAQQNAFLKEK